jgi:hypothetical protein
VCFAAHRAWLVVAPAPPPAVPTPAKASMRRPREGSEGPGSAPSQERVSRPTRARDSRCHTHATPSYHCRQHMDPFRTKMPSRKKKKHRAVRAPPSIFGCVMWAHRGGGAVQGAHRGQVLASVDLAGGQVGIDVHPVLAADDERGREGASEAAGGAGGWLPWTARSLLWGGGSKRAHRREGCAATLSSLKREGGRLPSPLGCTIAAGAGVEGEGGGEALDEAALREACASCGTGPRQSIAQPIDLLDRLGTSGRECGQNAQASGQRARTRPPRGSA